MIMILNILISGIAIAIASYITPGAHIDGYITAIIVAVVLALVNSSIGFCLKLITFPINVLTLGLMSLIINILMVLLVAKIIPGFTIDSFFSAFIFAVILALINMVIVGNIVKK
ncbi:phage holin family protein [Candidatus Gracilibacteria bacterium]|nr:phage holin family protein [Candidatus Gracilibacteria bacterium]NUJ98438.1 phage holin family protein [Candidatus Gracilibacteria bacterium]